MLKVTNIQKSFNGHHVLKALILKLIKVKLLLFWVHQVQAKPLFTLFKFARTPGKGVLAFTDGSLTIDFSKDQQNR